MNKHTHPSFVFLKLKTSSERPGLWPCRSVLVVKNHSPAWCFNFLYLALSFSRLSLSLSFVRRRGTKRSTTTNTNCNTSALGGCWVGSGPSPGGLDFFCFLICKGVSPWATNASNKQVEMQAIQKHHPVLSLLLLVQSSLWPFSSLCLISRSDLFFSSLIFAFLLFSSIFFSVLFFSRLSSFCFCFFGLFVVFSVFVSFSCLAHHVFCLSRFLSHFSSLLIKGLCKYKLPDAGRGGPQEPRCTLFAVIIGHRGAYKRCV